MDFAGSVFLISVAVDNFLTTLENGAHYIRIARGIRGELEEAAEAFEVSLSTVDGAVDEHIAGTADVAARVREGMVIIRILDGIVKNVYNGNPGKFAAWTAAAHVERDPKKAPANPA